MNRCWDCNYHRYLRATFIDPSEEWCEKHDDLEDFDPDDCPDYYNEADARADAKYKDCDRY